MYYLTVKFLVWKEQFYFFYSEQRGAYRNWVSIQFLEFWPWQRLIRRCLNTTPLWETD